MPQRGGQGFPRAVILALLHQRGQQRKQRGKQPRAQHAVQGAQLLHGKERILLRLPQGAQQRALVNAPAWWGDEGIAEITQAAERAPPQIAGFLLGLRGLAVKRAGVIAQPLRGGGQILARALAKQTLCASNGGDDGYIAARAADHARLRKIAWNHALLLRFYSVYCGARRRIPYKKQPDEPAAMGSEKMKTVFTPQAFRPFWRGACGRAFQRPRPQASWRAACAQAWRAFR